MRFTTPEIEFDSEVMPEDELKSVDGRVASKGAFDVAGQQASGEVLKAKEVIPQPSSFVNEKDGETKVFDVVEHMPSYAGGKYTVKYTDEKGNMHKETKMSPPGQAGLFQYLSDNIKYPVVAEENGVQGRVIVTFVVERDGSITEVKVVKSVDPALDREAVRVTKSMPKWNPGKQNGSPVRVLYTMPVTFRLQ